MSIYIYIYMYIHVYVCMYVCIYNTHTHTHTHTHIYLYICIYTYTYIHTHKHTHTQTHTQTHRKAGIALAHQRPQHPRCPPRLARGGATGPESGQVASPRTHRLSLPPPPPPGPPRRAAPPPAPAPEAPAVATVETVGPRLSAAAGRRAWVAAGRRAGTFARCRLVFALQPRSQITRCFSLKTLIICVYINIDSCSALYSIDASHASTASNAQT